MSSKKKKFNFAPRSLSSNKQKKKLFKISSDNSQNPKNVIQQNLYENNFQSIDNKANIILNTDNNENVKEDLKYLMSANEKEQIDFISTLLKLKGIQKKENNNRINTDIKNVEENLINIINNENKKKKHIKGKEIKNELDKIYNSKTMNSKTNNIKEITIDLMDLKPKQFIKPNNIRSKKEKSPKIKSYDKKLNKSIKHNEKKIFRTKTVQKSPNKNIKIKNNNLYKNKNYNKDIEIKKKQLLEGKQLNLISERNYLNFYKLHKNIRRNIHTENPKKLNFPIINESKGDKTDILNIKVYKTRTNIKEKNKQNKNNETIKTYINNDNDEIHNDNNKRLSKINKNNNNNSLISNDKDLVSFFSSSTFNNDLVNYKSILQNQNQMNNNINNLTNTNFSIITNSMINNDNNKTNDEKISFQIENNSNSNNNNTKSDILMSDTEKNEISDIILLDNKEKIKSKINVYNNGHNSENSSKDEESIVEQFDINHNIKQNESKEIKLSQIDNENKDIINNTENNNISKSNANISITNISKLTNFVDSKFLEVSHYSKKPDNRNNRQKSDLSNKNDEINIKRIEHKKVKKTISKKEIPKTNIKNNNDNYFELKLIEKEKEPQDRKRNDCPKDNYRKKNKKLNTTKNSKKNIFEESDLSPTKKLILTNKRDVIYAPFQIIFNNQIEKRNKSKGHTLKGFTLNSDNNIYQLNNNKEFSKKKYYYTSISPDKNNNIKQINQNISIKNNINNNFIINYNN